MRRWARRAIEGVGDGVRTLHWMAFRGLGLISRRRVYMLDDLLHDVALNMHSWI
jgi:hypothetical protein